MSWHPEVLPEAQKRALGALGPVMTRRGFYLGGGTAVAAHLGHRRSVDLDWFSADGLGEPSSFAKSMQDEGVRITVRRIMRGAVHGHLLRVRVSFLEYGYPLLLPAARWTGYGCPVASLDDLACMKLSVAAQRGAKKDFVDLYALGLRHAPLSDMLSHYQRKYAVKDIVHVLRGLVYFDDADAQRMPSMLWDVNWRTVKTTIQGWVKHFIG